MFLKSVFKVGSLTLISRLFGFIRDMITALYLGAGPVADAFFVAFRLPNFFRHFFAEGAFSAAFVPLFSGILTKKGRPAALIFARHSLGALMILLLIFTVLAEIFMPQVMSIVAPGFQDDPDKFALAVEFARYTFPYLFFISCVALMGGVLNSLNHFAAFAAAPILLNLALIFALLVFTPFAESAGHAMAYGVFLAGVLQFLYLYLDLRLRGVRLGFGWPKLTPEVRRLGKLALPGTFGAGVMQVNLLIATLLASFLPSGSVSYLYYADRISQLPLGVIGIAISTALLPILTRQIRSEPKAVAMKTQTDGIELGLIMALPAMIALIIIPDLIYKVLFERGAFDAATTANSAAALQAMSLGLPAFILVKVLAPGFFAREDTRTPVKIAALTVALNVLLNLILMKPLLHVGLALGTAIAFWFNAVCLYVLLRRRGHLTLESRFYQRFGKILLAAVMMGVFLITCRQFFPQTDFMFQLIYFIALVLLSMLVYFGLLAGLGVVTRQTLKQLKPARIKKVKPKTTPKKKIKRS